MTERRDFDEGEELLKLSRFGHGFLRLALHFFVPSDKPDARVPWLDLSAKKDADAPRTRVTLKPRELRALAGALVAAADRLEAEGFDLAPPAPRPARQAGPGGGSRPAQHRTVGARDFLPGHRRPLGGGRG
ncbi:MAG TPA: hypothetical protein VFS43_40770 [Polyangiaceae bacterium]|nr:hypothetical protein [Polyangiaceae bacterium]